MRLGASTLLFRDRPLDRDLLAKMADAGVDAVELTDYHPGFSYVDSAAFRDLRETLDQLGLQLNSLHAHLEYFDADCNLAALDHRQQKDSLVAYKRAVEAVGHLGGGILLTHDIRISEPPADATGAHDGERAAFLRNLGELADFAEPLGVRIALENTGRGYTREPERLVALMRDLDRGNVGVCIDTGHRNLVGDPAEALRIVKDHLITLHIHDNSGERDEHLLPGAGQIAWPDVVGALRDIDYGGVFLYELAQPEFASSVRANFEALWGM